MDGTPAANATLRRRIGSLCYECVLLIPILFIGGWIFAIITQSLDPAVVHPIFQAYLLLIMGAYFVYCWTHGGQTLAMKTWRIKLETNSYQPLPTKIALCRYVFAVMGALCFGLGFAWALFDRDRQFLHDRLAKTHVVSWRLPSNSKPAIA